MKICPEWFVITSNYSLEELTDGDAALYRALLRRADNGVRVFEFGENYYMPEEADIDDELHRFYRRRLLEFVDKVVNSHLTQLRPKSRNEESVSLPPFLHTCLL